ncbi:MAG: hypothetical protein Q9170_004608 [Blastenia crenularia]
MNGCTDYHHLDLGHVANNYDHFTYELNTTICHDGTVCPNNDFATSNNTCCDNHQGRPEINYHNNAALPIAASDLPDYYSSAGYTIPTDGVYKTATQSTYTATTRSTPASQAANTSPATPTSTSSPTPTPAPSSGLSSGAKAGIGVGVVLGVLAIAALAIFFWMRKRKANLKRAPTQGNMEYKGVPMQEQEPMYGNFKGELPADSARMELDSEPQPKMRTHEMQG